MLAHGSDPGELKKEAKRQATLIASNSFEAIAAEWLDKKNHHLSESTREVKRRRLEAYVLPKLGGSR